MSASWWADVSMTAAAITGAARMVDEARVLFALAVPLTVLAVFQKAWRAVRAGRDLPEVLLLPSRDEP